METVHLSWFLRLAVRTVVMGTLSACIMALTSCAGRSMPAGAQREDANSAGNAPARATYVCSDDAHRKTSRLQRLSKRQYQNALRDLITALVPADDGRAVWTQLAPLFVNVPSDTLTKHAPFSTMDQALSQQHADIQFRIAHVTANALTDSEARVRALLQCERGVSDNRCVDDFIRRFARLAFRRAVTEADVNFLHGVYYAQGIDLAGLTDVIEAVLTSPFFLYRVELGDRPIAGKRGLYALTNHELANRLAFTFWQTAPDEALMKAADRGELANDDGYARALDRVVHDARADEGFATFVTEWLALEELREMNALVGDPVFDAFRGKTAVDQELREEMIADVVDAFVYHVKRDDTYADFLLSPYSFARKQGLAAIYGVPAWDGQATPPSFPKGERAGLLTRAALVATGTANTRPIMKGVFVRERLLCDRLPPPPANASNGLLELSPTATTRETVEHLTEQPNSSCAFCHAGRINALGYATENYDALGRVRSAQTLFSPTGNIVGKRIIDTASVPHIWPDDERVASGAEELADIIRTSGKGEKCFALQYARFTLGRAPEESADGCFLEELRASLTAGTGLRRAMLTMAMRPEFRQRFVGEVQ